MGVDRAEDHATLRRILLVLFEHGQHQRQIRRVLAAPRLARNDGIRVHRRHDQRQFIFIFRIRARNDNPQIPQRFVLPFRRLRIDMRRGGTFYQCVAQILAVIHADQEARQADFRSRHFCRRVAIGGFVFFNENEADDAKAQQPLPFRPAGEFHDGDGAVELRPFNRLQGVFIAVSNIDQRRVK